MELVIPVIPSNYHRRCLVSVSTSTLSIDNEIVGNEDCQVCVLDLVSTSTESIESNLLVIKKSPPYRAKAKGKWKGTLDIVTSLELVHDNLPKNSEISGMVTASTTPIIGTSAIKNASQIRSPKLIIWLAPYDELGYVHNLRV